MPKKLHFYYLNGEETVQSSSYHAVLTTHLSNFEYIDGCSGGIGQEYLIQDNIGKKFDVEILDPFLIGECELLGFTLDAIPDEELREKLEDERAWLECSCFFKILSTGDFLVVEAHRCNAKPLF